MSLFDYETSFIEIEFPENSDNFLKVKETLTRIGAPAYTKSPTGEQVKTLWQSCHILYKRQRYWLVHFKEMFLLDGKASRTVITEEDLARRNAVATLLEEWGLIRIVSKDRVTTPVPAPVETLKIIPFKEKGNWQLQAKYEIGKSRFR